MNALKCRNDLAIKLAKRTGILKKDCLKLMEAMIEEMVIELKSGRGVHLPTLGKFEYYVRGTKRNRDPITGVEGTVPPVTRIKFSPCNDVKYGVAVLDWEPHLSEYQTEAEWYKKILKERETNDK